MSEDAVTRRDAVRISLAASGLMLVGSCRSTPPSTVAFEEASNELGSVLRRIGEDDVERAELAALGRHIRVRAHEMVGEHREFQRCFDELSVRADIPTERLAALGRTFCMRRIAMRDELLRLQDALRRALSSEEWDEVVRVLNRKARAIRAARTDQRG